MKHIAARIGELDLDWREAEQLLNAMRSMEKEQGTLLAAQSPAFQCMWLAVRKAAKRNVKEKAPAKPPMHADLCLLSLEWGYKAHVAGQSLEQAMKDLKKKLQTV